MVVIYLTLVELGKNLFFKHLPMRPRLPVESWELTPTLQTVERFASRWTVGSRSRRKAERKRAGTWGSTRSG
jgi:hypothetical protein